MLPADAPPGSSVVPVTSAADGGVQLVRVEAPERVFDRDKVLGRDAASVFPSLAQTNADRVVSATQAVVGSMNFVTESELEEIKAKRGGALRPEDGTAEEQKPLWAVLQEAKEAKEEAFQQGWKTIKQGQNKPLDEDEVEFLDDVDAQAREDERRRADRDRDDVETFRLMRETMVVVRAADDAARPAPAAAPNAAAKRRRGAIGAAARDASAEPATKAAGKAAAGARWRPVVRLAKRKKAEPESGGKEKDDAADAPPPEKKPPTRDRDEGEEDAGGLGGLLGYGSDDSDGGA
jgi:hypothetical protein